VTRAEDGETVTNLRPERHIVVSYTPGTDNLRAMPGDGEHHDADARALRDAADLLDPDGRADLADRFAAVEALCVEATQRAYMTIALDKVLTVMPVPGDLERAFVPSHWREEAEAAATVAVTHLRAALGDPAATLAEVKAAAWDEGASGALRTPQHLGYALDNPYRDRRAPHTGQTP